MRRITKMKTISWIFLVVFLFLITGCSGTVPTTLSPPTNVSASITFLNKVQVTWDAVSGATHYQVYRADALLGVKIALSGWQVDTSYDDTSASGGITYYYWVKAATGSSGDDASDFSIPDTGHTIAVSLYLDPPTNVSASYNLPYRVQVTWDTVIGASHYRVYRADSLLGTKVAFSGWQTGTTFDDYTVIPYDTYYYWVEAATSSSGDNASDYSYSSTGLATSNDLDPPTNVLASDNLVDKVRVTWDTVFGATHYQVYRRPQGTITKPTPISGWQTGTSYDDTSATPGTYYDYQVKAAINGSGDYDSSFSDIDTGHAIS